MLLITTAEQQFWEFDKQVIFLGEWCKLFSKQVIWQRMQYEVLPYHWDDRRKLYNDYLYLDGLYEKILANLTETLNSIHHVNHSLRYWRLLVGPWLFYFIQILFDRYQSIMTAKESGKVTDTYIGNYNKTDWVPQDFAEFSQWVEKDDAYNHFIYGCIIELTGQLSYTALPITIEKEKPKADFKKKYKLHSQFKKFLAYVNTAICSIYNQFVFVDSGLKITDLIKVHLALRQIPYIFSKRVKTPTIAIRTDLRNQLSNLSAENEFEKLLDTLIRQQIPSIYLEGYALMNRLALRAFPKKPRVILNAVAFYANDAFKFWAAHHTARGTIVTGIQNGGHYGTGLWSSTERHQIKIYDRFYTWGWKSASNRTTKPLPAAQLNKIKGKIRPKTGGRLLMVQGAVPRYAYYMHSVSVASSGFLTYLAEQYRFVDNLSEKNKKRLTVRLYPLKYGWHAQERWSIKFPEIEYSTGASSLIDNFNKSALFIGTYNATTFLETFAANFPTILFWNPDHWEIRSIARRHFEMLLEAGILHDTPESAAAKVNEVANDPITWWNRPDIQTAKNHFCQEFAQTANNWLNQWRSEMLSLLGSSRTGRHF